MLTGARDIHMAKAKILITDDHRVVIEGIKSALRDHEDFEVVGEAVNGRDAVRKVRTLEPDIVIMDISMPDLNGIDSTLQIKKINPDVAVIIFSMYSSKEYVIDLFRAGISAYILKEDPMSQLLAALKEAKAGRKYFSEMVQQIMLDHLTNAGPGQAMAKDPFEGLSLREREVFQLLAEGASIKDIARRLNLSPKTVESHKYHILQKLKVQSVNDLTKMAIRKKIISI